MAAIIEEIEMKLLLPATVLAALAMGAPAFAAEGPRGHSHNHAQGHGHAHAHGHAHHEETEFGRPGDPKRPSRVIEIVMRERSGAMEFSPNSIQVKKGEQIRFKLRNAGALDHELVLGTLEENLKHAEEMKKNPDMEHDDPNAKRLAPKKRGEILWRFDKTGEFDFSCLIPGHREAGMSGKITVR
jgi:uncharacterized cupredoxin-like copper-binding protein